MLGASGIGAGVEGGGDHTLATGGRDDRVVV